MLQKIRKAPDRVRPGIPCVEQSWPTGQFPGERVEEAGSTCAAHVQDMHVMNVMNACHVWGLFTNSPHIH